MQKYVFVCTLTLTILVLLFFVQRGLSQPPTPPDDNLLNQDAVNEAEIIWNPLTETPSFVRAQVPFTKMGLTHTANPETIALAFVKHYAGLFGVEQASGDLKVVRAFKDALGMVHVHMSQVYGGIEVYNASIVVHLDADGQSVMAASNGYVPGIETPVTPKVSVEEALALAQMALPVGELVSDPELVIYPSQGSNPGASAHLAWMVELIDDSLPARNVYFVDAIRGNVVAVLDRLYEELNREVYTANNGYSLPGTLARSEGDPPTGDQDVDNAYDFSGATYNYYFNTHEQDSYDNQGATLVSTVHYGISYMNAYWDGEQMVYGDHMSVEDVTAHELTHAVTEYTANLEYRWQSGALNESFSDIFAAMVDREDWLMGEDLPAEILGGREAIRDLSDPTRFDQPDHTEDWVQTCSDNEGVHTNSGIPNKAYYNIATAISKEKAELIFYRALTTYLSATASLEDARAAALQSAQDLYGGESAEYLAVQNGFNAVGLDGEWNPPENDCLCSALTALSDLTTSPDQVSATEAAITLYRLRDQILETTEAGQYYLGLYERYTGRISLMLLLNPSLRESGARILQQVTPGLNSLIIGKEDDAIITAETVIEVQTYLRQLAEEDRARGGGELAQSIEREMARIDWYHLVGMTYDEAWVYLSQRVTFHTAIFLPIVTSR